MTSPGFPTKYTQLWAHTRAGDVLDDDTTYPEGVDADSPLEEILQASVEGGGGGGGSTVGPASRVAASSYHILSEFGGIDVVSASMTPGRIYACLADVVGGTFDTISVQVGTASSPGGDLYIGVYDLDSELMPATAQAVWGPFDCSSTGTVTLTGQTQTIAGGRVCIAVMPDTNNDGNIAIDAYRGAGPNWFGTPGASTEYQNGIVSGDAGLSSLPADLSTPTNFTFGTASATEFGVAVLHQAFAIYVADTA